MNLPADRADLSASDGPLLVERAEAVATVTLNRPRRANAVDETLGEALDAALLDLARDASVRVVILTGAGGHFCAGGDVSRLEQVLADRGAHLADRDPRLPQPKYAALGDGTRAYHSRYLLPAAMGKPVIAAIEGACAGVGLVMALACDMRVVAGDARIAAGFAERGLIAETGISQLVTRIAGAGMAARLLIACERIDGSEAHRCHLAEHLALPGQALPTARAVAERIATHVSPRSATVIKRQIQAQFADLFASGVKSDFAAMLESFSSDDFVEGLTSFLEHRPAQFQDRQENDR